MKKVSITVDQPDIELLVKRHLEKVYNIDKDAEVDLKCKYMDVLRGTAWIKEIAVVVEYEDNTTITDEEIPAMSGQRKLTIGPL